MKENVKFGTRVFTYEVSLRILTGRENVLENNLEPFFVEEKLQYNIILELNELVAQFEPITIEEVIRHQSKLLVPQIIETLQNSHSISSDKHHFKIYFN